MDTLKTRFMHLHRCRYIGRNSLKKLFLIDPTLKSMYDWDTTTWQHYFNFSVKETTAIQEDLKSTLLMEKVQLDQTKCNVITILDENYPPTLYNIPDPPLVLYLKGNPQLLYQNSLSVIGSRFPSKFASPIMKQLIPSLIKNQLTIVSGMARGVDGLAHEITINEGGSTIAIIASGFEHVYPPEHKWLYHKLSAEHLVVSEYPPTAPPRRYQFPERNRLISGLSFGTLIIEAKEKSGSLITVEQALDQGREIFAVPGALHMETSKGCNRLIQEGAKLVQNSEDILIEWEVRKNSWQQFLIDSDAERKRKVKDLFDKMQESI